MKLLLAKIEPAKFARPKISKVAAGYVYRPGTDYRCRDCLLFISAKEQCALFGPRDVVRPEGYCIYWAYGTPPVGLTPREAYTPGQAGYGENPRGTKCRRCRNFDPAGLCRIVEGSIDPNACCSAQVPNGLA